MDFDREHIQIVVHHLHLLVYSRSIIFLDSFPPVVMVVVVAAVEMDRKFQHHLFQSKSSDSVDSYGDKYRIG